MNLTGGSADEDNQDNYSLSYTVGSWSMLILLYFLILLLLQRTIGQERAIGGQVSWKSIIFKKADVSGMFSKSEFREYKRLLCWLLYDTLR